MRPADASGEQQDAEDDEDDATDNFPNPRGVPASWADGDPVEHPDDKQAEADREGDAGEKVGNHEPARKRTLSEGCRQRRDCSGRTAVARARTISSNTITQSPWDRSAPRGGAHQQAPDLMINIPTCGGAAMSFEGGVCCRPEENVSLAVFVRGR